MEDDSSLHFAWSIWSQGSANLNTPTISSFGFDEISRNIDMTLTVMDRLRASKFGVVRGPSKALNTIIILFTCIVEG